jgi:hypothetical protein
MSQMPVWRPFTELDLRNQFDECPEVQGVAPTGCPESPPPPTGGDVTRTFVRLDNGGQTYAIEIPPYVCVRRTGGTSVLQIAKVVNGVQTVLKSTPVLNPPVGQPFDLRCQVSSSVPTTITLSLNGVVKLTVTSPCRACIKGGNYETPSVAQPRCVGAGNRICRYERTRCAVLPADRRGAASMPHRVRRRLRQDR